MKLRVQPDRSHPHEADLGERQDEDKKNEDVRKARGKGTALVDDEEMMAGNSSANGQ